MSIKTNHITEALTPESGVLSINAEGAIKLPLGNVTSRPSGIKGYVRFNDNLTADPEYYDGLTWQLLTNKDYVDAANQELQSQIDSIISNIDPAALDSLTEIVKAFQDADIDITTAISTLTTSLSNEQQARIDADSALDTRVSTVEDQVNGKIGDLTSLTTDNGTTIVGAINEIDSNLDALQLNLQQQITDIISNLDSEALDSIAEIVTQLQVLQDNIDTEHQHHVDAEAALQSELDATQLGAGLEVDGSYIISGTNYIDSATSLKSADILLDAALKAAETNLSTTLTNLTLDDLADVSITTPTDGQVLVYDVITGEFRTQTQAMNVITKSFIADGVTYDFDMGTSVSSVHNIVVTVNGIQQEPIYSFVLTNGSIITFDEAPESGDKIQVKILRTSAQTDRPRPRVTDITYGSLGVYTTITITATDISYGTGVKIGDKSITRLDYISANQIQVMIQSSLMTDSFWNNPHDLTLTDTSGNEFVYYNLISYGTNKPHFTNSNGYIGSFSSGDSINFALPINNSTSITLGPAYAGETALSWLSISGNSIVGTAPQNSSPSRYELSVTASNGSVNITKNYWMLVV